MNIDRRTLRVTHPAYVELKGHIHEELRSFFSVVRSRIYEAESADRKDVQVDDALRSIELLAQSSPRISQAANRSIGEAWKGSKRDHRLRKAILRRYTVPDFYTIVLEVASNVLTAKQLGNFLRKLTERLSRG